MASPYDQTFKSLADLDPEALLRWMGVLDPEKPAIILTPPRDLHTPSRVPDLLYEVRSGDARRLIHIEAQTRYHSSLPERILEYAALSWPHYRLPVVSYVLLLTSHDCPASLPRQGEVRVGGLRMRYKRIKLWEVSPAPAMASNRPSLLPFVALMRSKTPELDLVARKLGQIDNDGLRRELAARFVLLGGLRYDRTALKRLVEGHMITREEMAESVFYQMILEEGGAKIVRRQLERRFGPLPSWAAERLKDASVQTLETWGLRVMDAPGAPLEALLASPDKA